MKFKFLNLVLCSLLFLPFSSISQVITWDGDSDGDGDGEKWEDPLNWNLDQVPKSGNIVNIGGDSVIVNSDLEIAQLILNPNGILNIRQSSSNVFLINNSPGEGVTIDGSAKLYIEGEMHIINSALNGIDLQVNGFLKVENPGILYINQANSDGILGGIGGEFINDGEIYIENIGGDGLDVRSFTNTNYIGIEDCNGNGAVIAGSIAINNGDLWIEEPIIFQNSTNFTNGVGAEIVAFAGITISSDFWNYGILDSRNITGTSINIATNVILTNEGEIRIRPASDDVITLSNGGAILTKPGASVILTNTGLGAIPGKYILTVDGIGTTFENQGLTNFQINGKREGIKVSNRGRINNIGDFYLKDFYAKGIVFDPYGSNYQGIYNIDTAHFEIGKGVTAGAVALELNTRVTVTNDTCATLILEDSLAVTGTLGMKVSNYGFLQVEKFYKKSNGIFENEGAVYIADSALAFSPNPTLIGQIDNDGLVYHTQLQPIVSGNIITNFFAAINTSNVDLIGNSLFVSNGSGMQTPSGQYSTATNSWTPPVNAAGKDSVFFNYRLTGGTCDLRNLVMPFISSSPCANAVTLTFTGNTNDKWNMASNWSPAQVPTACDHVIIPSGKTCTLVLNYPGFGIAKTVLIESGAVFETDSGILWTVDPSN